MSRGVRTLAAALAALALVAALPACGCAAERTRHATGHECCAPPVGVSSAGRGCCDEAPAIAAVPQPAGPDAAAPSVVAVLGVEIPPALGALARPSDLPAPSPPPTVLRI
jgi:hypothetical protein